ncbi:MAG: amino acid carrier protein [Oscillospiraceae bacterium]|jgi:AGCS family alanine or glycine:cation symporter|nr:amino acid carrier protein [Oscillospiraceae bacterium]
MEILSYLNRNFLWGYGTVGLFALLGVYFTVKCRLVQFRLPSLLSATLLRKTANDGRQLSPVQALSSVLAMTLGTGNIIAIGGALKYGGAGALFWLVVSGFLCMGLAYAENYLGALYRKNGEGGAFRYIKAALGRNVAVVYAACSLICGFVMGNMAQTGAMSHVLSESFSLPSPVSGLFAAVILGLVCLGGAKLFGQLAERFIPLLSALYIGGCVLVVVLNAEAVPDTITRIFTEAFSIRAASGGAVGGGMIAAMSWGLRRGIFSNEAGLGTSVTVGVSSAETSADRIGKWSVLSIYIDTVLMCSATGFMILVCKTESLGESAAAAAFAATLGGGATKFVAVSVALFALATAAGYSVFVRRTLSFLTKNKAVHAVVLTAYAAAAYFGAQGELPLLFELADSVNILLALPNIAAVVLLSRKLVKQNRS